MSKPSFINKEKDKIICNMYLERTEPNIICEKNNIKRHDLYNILRRNSIKYNRQLNQENNIYKICAKCYIPLTDENWLSYCKNRKYNICNECFKLSKMENYKKIKLDVLYHYSNGTLKCGCCGENDFNSLTIDHINNDGAKHRKKISIGSGQSIYQWLIKNNFPEGFQVLCMNCNCIKQWVGTNEYRKGKYS